jgi:hypothetical protein
MPWKAIGRVKLRKVTDLYGFFASLHFVGAFLVRVRYREGRGDLALRGVGVACVTSGEKEMAPAVLEGGCKVFGR